MATHIGKYVGIIAIYLFVAVASAQEAKDPADPSREALRRLVSLLAADELDTTTDAVVDYEASVSLPHLGVVVAIQHVEGDYGLLVASREAELPYAYGRPGLSIGLESGDKATVRLFEETYLGLQLKPGDDGEGLVFGIYITNVAEDAGLVLRLRELLESVLRKAEKVTYEVKGTTATAVCHTTGGAEVTARFDIADAKKPRVMSLSFASDGTPVLACHVTYLHGKAVRPITALTERDLTAQGLAVKAISLREVSTSLVIPPPKFFDEPAHRSAGEMLLRAFPVDQEALKAENQRKFR